MEEAKKRDHQLANKKKMLEQRQLKTIGKIKGSYLNRCATIIQRKYREYAARTKNDDQNSVISGKASEAPPEKKPTIALSKLLQPIKAVSGAVAKLRAAVLDSGQLVPEAERPRIINAILRYQVKSILQEGIVDIHVTLGEIETKSFGSTQHQLKVVHLPYFDRVDNDLSGVLGLQIFLWIMRGAGDDCITKIIIQSKPEKTSQAAMKMRESEGLSAGIRFCWHPHLPIEVQGLRTIKQGKGDFAVQDVQIAITPEVLELMDSGVLSDYLIIIVLHFDN